MIVNVNLGTALHFTMNHLCVLLHCEGATRCRLPDILLIVVVLADHANLVRHKVALLTCAPY